jgi:hypothetical protein
MWSPLRSQHFRTATMAAEATTGNGLRAGKL